ncbi:MAG: response regulator transcription factor [Chitinophagaceae bacterium]|jgi:DNA-binding NarL/FixJ family response regulator|nr:response regulator transcription factor [Chitinophagaceae bacterium]
MKKEMVTVAIADDHRLFLKSLSMLVNGFDNYSVIAEALNGKELISLLENSAITPDLILLDVNMPVMDGVETAKYLTTSCPAAKIVALSMNDDSVTIIRMLRAGCCAYLLKDIHPNELEKALNEIIKTGYYNADTANVNYRRLLAHSQEECPELNDKEMAFLRHASTDATYKQIAYEMNLSTRTVDGYRELLFKKFNVQSRVGMVMEALRKNLIRLNG